MPLTDDVGPADRLSGRNVSTPPSGYGDTAVIGASDDDHAGGPFSAGSAYVFVRAGGVWAQQVKLTASDAAAYDHFGASVSVSSATAVIGAVGGDSVANSAYVFDLGCAAPGDLDGDGDVELDDFVLFADCLNDPYMAYPAGGEAADLEGGYDGDVDEADFAVFQAAF